MFEKLEQMSKKRHLKKKKKEKNFLQEIEKQRCDQRKQKTKEENWKKKERIALKPKKISRRLK